nr:Mpo1-like protein [uncultured Pedobacter sp.]
MKKEEKRQIDILFDRYSESHQNPTNKLIHWICVPLIVFSIIGLLTAIPFPHIAFLGKYNMYINWFSFVLAVSIYYYSTLSPILSYLMLFFFGICYFFVIQLEYLERGGGPALWQVSLAIFILAWIGQFVGHKIEGKKPSFLDDLRFLLIGPIWLLHFVLKKLNVRY